MPQPVTLPDAAATERAGRQLAHALLACRPERLCIFLEGDLGAGKTTFARGFLRGMGHEGRVPSPTYTLVEPYDVGAYQVYHLDLYRLNDGAELEFLGITEMTAPGGVLLVEWPSRARDHLPDSDLKVELKVISQGREIMSSPGTAAGARILAAAGTSG